MAAKWVFMFAYHGEYAFSMGDVLDVTLHGLSLDLSTALYFFVLPFLLTIISLWVSIPKWVYYAYYVLIAVAFALAFVADTSLYAFWEFKLDASCLQYLESPTEAMARVTTGYLALRVLLVLLVTLLMTFLYIKVSPPHHPPRTSHLLPFTSHLLPPPHPPHRHRHQGRLGRIDHQHRTGVLLAKPVPQPLGGQPRVLLPLVIGQVGRLHRRLQLLHRRRVCTAHRGHFLYRE